MTEFIKLNLGDLNLEMCLFVNTATRDVVGTRCQLALNADGLNLLDANSGLFCCCFLKWEYSMNIKFQMNHLELW